MYILKISNICNLKNPINLRKGTLIVDTKSGEREIKGVR